MKLYLPAVVDRNDDVDSADEQVLGTSGGGLRRQDKTQKCIVILTNTWYTEYCTISAEYVLV